MKIAQNEASTIQTKNNGVFRLQILQNQHTKNFPQQIAPFNENKRFNGSCWDAFPMRHIGTSINILTTPLIFSRKTKAITAQQNHTPPILS